MQYQNNSNKKLTKKQIRQGYTLDNMDKEESPIKKVLIAGAIGAFGIGAYKSGLLKKTISNLIDYAGNSKNVAPGVMTAFKSWTLDTKEVNDSLLRSSFKENITKALKHRYGFSDYMKYSYGQTVKDLKNLDSKVKEYVAKRLDNWNDRDFLNYRNTDMFYNLSKIENATSRFKGRSREQAKEIMTKDFMKKFKLTKEEKQLKLKRTGYAPMTLGDMIEPIISEDGNITLKETSQYFNLDSSTRKKIKDFITNTKAVDENGNYIKTKYNRYKTIAESGEYKDLIFDHNILINEKGDFADIRTNINDFKSFVRSAANDFKIPFVGINPLKFFGLGKVGIKEPLFETLSTNTIQPGISGKIGNKILKDIDGFDERRLLYSNGSIYKYNNDIQNFEKIKSNMSLKKYSHNGNVDKMANNYRKMADIRITDYEEYTKEDGFLKYYKGKISKFLDLGRQDTASKKYEDNIFTAPSPNSLFEKISNKAFEKMNFTKSSKVRSIEEAFGTIDELEDNYEEKLYVAIKKHIKWKDVMDPLNNANIRDYFSQFMKGRKNIDEVTESSLIIYNLFERMNQSLKPFGISLGMDSIGSTKDVISGMLMKRFLPVYMSGQAIEYLTYLSEDDEEDENGSRNIKQKLANRVAKIHLGATKVKDEIGITELFKSIKDSVPGSESFTELPIIKNLGLDRNYEEQKKWYETGMEAIRKGRYWDLGNTAFIGCLTKASELITENGIMKVEDITTSNLLIAKDGMYHKILASKIRDANEMIYKINMNFDSCNNVWLTGNHNLYVVKKEYCHYSNNTYCIPKNINKKCTNCKYKYYEKYTPIWVPIEDINEKDYMVTTVIQKPTNLNNKIFIKEILDINKDYIDMNKDYIDINKDLGYLLGFYTAKGYSKNNTIKISFKLNETEYINNIIMLFKNIFNINAKVVYYKNSCTISVCSKYICEIFRTLVPEKSIRKNKKISKHLLDISNEDMWIGFLYGFIKCSSYKIKNKQKIIIRQSSYEVLKNIQSILLRFKILSSITSHTYKKGYLSYKLYVDGNDYNILESLLNNNINNKYILNNNKIKDTDSKIEFFICDDIAALSIKSINVKEYNGPVYDFEVDKEESFINGFIMHNSKVSHFEPNWYRKIMADADFSENKWGSRKEYFQNTWYPTPTNPLAPIRHFITDKYHYEKKHYFDRPYLLTSPEFENVPLFGNFLSATVGKLVKPQRRMHEEYWNGPYGTNSINKDSFYIPYDKSEEGNENLTKDIFSNDILNNYSDILDGNSNYKAIERKGSVLGEVNQNLSIDGKEVYITSSGNLGFVDINRKDINEIKYKLKDSSPKSMLGVNINPNREPLNHLVGKSENGELVNSEGEVIINPNSIMNSISNQYMDTTNVLGLYGFLTNTYVTGDIGSKKDVIETPGYAFSYNNSFWEKNLGGLGGDVSEIFRRFVQKRRNDVDYYNPIRNTQPNFMPGENYFQDFKHGDPFSKISNGELRLAGTPYEKLWGIRDPLELGIGSSFLGKSKDDIVAHFLQDDTITDDDLVDIVETGTKMHEEIEKEWIKDGLAIDVEGKIDDKENRIIGYYDAKIHDSTSKTGVAMVDIKTISNKGFNEIVKTGEAKDSHRRQVNYYLWATGNDKGYVHYVNRDNPNQRYTVGFNYSQELLEDSFKNLEDARNEILDRYENKQISRGDLYKPIDRFRILADVAPWSQEFAEMENILKASGMDEETKKIYDEIKERVKIQKKPHNTYEYRYKNADIKEVTTKVTKVRGNDIYTEFSGDKALNLAGIDLCVNGTVSEKLKIEEITKNIKENSTVKLLVEADDVRRNKGSMKAIVIDDKGVNINKELIKENVAEEDKSDYSAPGIHTRYTKSQIFFGSIWETIAHADTPINTKLLQVRSAKEDYERREVYGITLNCFI